MKQTKQSLPIGKKEIDKLFDSAIAIKNYELLKAYALLYYCGFRVSEVLQFSYMDIRNGIEHGYINAYISKQNKNRTVPFTKGATSLLSMLLPHTFSLVNFLKPVCSKHFNAKLNEHIKSVLGNGYTSHGFRRAFITDNLKASNGDIIAAENIKRIIGHKNVQTTLNYYHSDIDNMRGIISLAR